MTPNPFFSSSGQRPLVIAHRGARAHAPENTLAAARLAHNHGADLWELDVCRTRDGVLVVMHDDTCARTTYARLHPALAGRAPWPVHELTRDELRGLDAGSWFVEGDPFGRIALGEVGPGMCRAYKGEPVPTLAEALALTRSLRWRVNVEIKDLAGTPGDATVVDEVLSLVDDHALGACIAVGLHVNVWTVNSLREVARLTRMGVSGIITDIPGECLAALRAQRLRTDTPLRPFPPAP